MDFALSGATVGLLVGGIFILVVAIIIVIRALLKRRSTSDLGEKYKDRKWSSPMVARNKYPDVNIFRSTGPIFKFGLAMSLLVILLAFSYTEFEKEIFIPQDALVIDEEIEIEPPRTKEPPPPPPPPPPPVIEEVPDELITEEDEVEFVDQSVEEETVITEPVPEPEEEAPPPPPPPPPPPEPEVEEIFTIVEDKPRFPGCEDLATKKEKEQCSTQKLLEYLYKNIKYPAIARENGIEGRAIIQFVVEKDGKITDAKIVRNLGGGCGDEALRVVNSMNNMSQSWTPGKQRGRAVRVQYTLPVVFKLE